MAFYLVSFLLAAQFALPLYVSSTFLAEWIGEANVGSIYTLDALIGLLFLAIFPAIVRRLGAVRSFLVTALFSSAALATLPFLGHSLFVVAVFTTYLVSIRLLSLPLDIILESSSTNATTGEKRGLYFTVLNIGMLVGPLGAAILLTNGDYRRLYLTSAALLIPIMILVWVSYHRFHDPPYDRRALLPAMRALLSRGPVARIACANFLLYVFYAIMVIYTPIYLHGHLGFSWSTIGVLFSVMLTPFILLQYPLGRLADRLFGEKEILAIGFTIMALATVLLSFVTASSVFLWGAALCLTRVGAAAVEIMNESYFFKHINGADAHLISLYRGTVPLGYLVGPLLAMLFLVAFDLRFIFVALGLFMLAGVPLALSLKDTR